MASSVRKLNQTGHPTDQPDLETLRNNLLVDVTDAPERIVEAFEAGLDALSRPSTSVSIEEAAEKTFTEIQSILPLTADKNEQGLCPVLLASVLMCTAQHFPSRHVGQDLLLHTVKLIWSSPEEAWRKDFRWSVGMRMRDGWSGFTMENGEEEDDVQTPDEWLNLNSYNARLYGSAIHRWRNFPIWQLREGLEAELGPDQHENDCKIAVACEWIIQAGPKLLRETLINENDLDEQRKKSLSGGELWAGLPGLTTERWGFWKRRLAEVKAGVKTQLTLDYIEHAERAMTDVERKLAVLTI